MNNNNGNDNNNKNVFWDTNKQSNAIITNYVEVNIDRSYVDLARELKKWNMKVTVIPIITSALGTILKGSVRGIGKLGNEDKWRPFRQKHN